MLKVPNWSKFYDSESPFHRLLRVMAGVRLVSGIGRKFSDFYDFRTFFDRTLRHKAPILFLTPDELHSAKLSNMNLSVIKDEKAFYYRENFCHNEHLNLVGYSRVWGPLILSGMVLW